MPRETSPAPIGAKYVMRFATKINDLAQRSVYFAATIAVHRGRGRTNQRVTCQWAVGTHQWGDDTKVGGDDMSVFDIFGHGGGRGSAHSSSLNHGLPQ